MQLLTVNSCLHNAALTATELDGDSESIIRSYSSKLAEATVDPVWLANELSSEGLLDTQTRNDLQSIDGVSAYDKAVQLWNRMESHSVKFQENPRQADPHCL